MIGSGQRYNVNFMINICARGTLTFNYEEPQVLMNFHFFIDITMKIYTIFACAIFNKMKESFLANTSFFLLNFNHSSNISTNKKVHL